MIISMKMALIGGVAILAIAGITVGIVFATKGDDCTGFGKPINLKFEERDDGKLFLVWSSPDNLGDCSAKYKVTLTVNDEKEEPVRIDKREYEITVGNRPCADIHVAVTTVDEDNGESATAEIDYVISVGDVSSVNVTDITKTLTNNNWKLSWKRPSNYDKCRIKYTIQIGNGEKETIDVTTKTISNDILAKCASNRITITPFIQEKTGALSVTEITGDNGDISKIKVNDITQSYNQGNLAWSIKFKKPSTYEACTFEYLIHVNDEVQEQAISETEAIVLNNKLEKCAENEIGVIPVLATDNGKVNGQKESITIRGKVEDVTNVIVGDIKHEFDGSDWKLEWTRPEGLDECLVAYKMYIDGKVQEDDINDLTTTVKNSDLKKCVENNIEIVPLIEDEEGQKNSVKIKGDVGDVSKVTVGKIDSTLNSNIWTLTWQKPSDYEPCNVEYILYINDKPQDGEINDITTTIENIVLQKCTENKIEIEPLIENKTGAKSSTAIKGEVGDVSSVKVSDINQVYNDEDSTWTITWKAPTDYEECSPKYLVYIGETPQDPQVEVTETKILNNDLTACADNVISIQPVFETENGQKESVIIRGKVEDVSAVNVGDIKSELVGTDWILQWTEPADFQECNVKYKVYLEGIQHGEEIDSVTTTIKNDDLQKCAENNIEIVPLIEDEEGQKNSVKIEGELGEVSNVKVEEIAKDFNENDSIWTITWKRPTGFDNCQVSYAVYLGTESMGGEISEEKTTIKNDLIGKCMKGTIGIQPIIETKSGTKDVIDIKGDVGDVSAATVGTIVPKLDGEIWTLEWEKPSGYEQCDVVYKMYLNTEPQDGEINAITTTINNNDLQQCTDNQIEIEPIIETKTGTKSSVTIRGDMGDVANIKVEEIAKDFNEKDSIWTITWKRPTGFDKCQVSYAIYLGTESMGGEISEETTTIRNDLIGKCMKETIGIQPIIETKPGTKDVIDIKGDVGDVSAATVGTIVPKLDGDIWTLEWERPSGYEQCDIVYKMYLNTEPQDGEINAITTTINNSDLQQCADNQIEIEPIIETKTGTKSSATIRGDMGDVANIKVEEIAKEFNEEDSIWTITWKRPTGFDKCQVSYAIYLGTESMGGEISEEKTTIRNDLIGKCMKETIGIQPIIETKPGTKDVIDIKGDVGDVSAATVGTIVPKLDGGIWTLEWERPSGYEQCDIVYKMYLNTEPRDGEINAITTTINNSDLQQCDDNQIEIEPIIETKAGTKSSATIRGDMGDVASIKVEEIAKDFNENDSIWTITWKRPTGFDKCQVSYAIYLGTESMGGEITEEKTTIRNDLIGKCMKETIGIQPIIETKPGTKDVIDIKGDVGDVSAATVGTIVPKLDGDIWTLEWERPSGYEQCDIVYKMYLNTEPRDGEINAITTTINNSDLQQCADNQIEIEPIIETKTGTKSSATIRGDMGDVANIKVEEIAKDFNEEDSIWTITWKRPTGFDKCQVSYAIYLGTESMGGEITEEKTTIRNDLIGKCMKETIGIQPIIETKPGTKDVIDIKGDVGDVSAATVGAIVPKLGGDIWTLEWERPSGYEQCNIVYKMYLNTESQDGEINAITTTINNSDLQQCADNQIEIEPIIETKTGTKSSATIKGDIGNVSNVKVEEINKEFNENDSTWTITWKKPTGFDNCQVSYAIYLGTESMGGEITEEKTTIRNDLVGKCMKETIGIQPIIETKPGTKDVIEIKGDVGDVSAATVGTIAPKLDGDVWTLEWERPSGYEQCDIVYKMYLNTEPRDGEINAITTTINNSDLQQCADNQMEIEPIIETKTGTKSSATITGEPPVDGRITPESFVVELGNVNAVWKKNDIYENCNFVYTVKVIKDGVTELEKDDIVEENFNGAVDGITNCDGITATVMAKHVLEGENIEFTCTSNVSPLYFLRTK